MLLVVWPIPNDEKSLKNYQNAGKWVLIWEYSMRAFIWIPAWQGLNGFQTSLCPCPMDEISLSSGRVKRTISCMKSSYQFPINHAGLIPVSPSHGQRGRTGSLSVIPRNSLPLGCRHRTLILIQAVHPSSLSHSQRRTCQTLCTSTSKFIKY